MRIGLVAALSLLLRQLNGSTSVIERSLNVIGHQHGTSEPCEPERMMSGQSHGYRLLYRLLDQRHGAVDTAIE